MEDNTKKLTVIISGDTKPHKTALRMSRFYRSTREKKYLRMGVDESLAELLRKKFARPGLKVEVK